MIALAKTFMMNLIKYIFLWVARRVRIIAIYHYGDASPLFLISEQRGVRNGVLCLKTLTQHTMYNLYNFKRSPPNVSFKRESPLIDHFGNRWRCRSAGSTSLRRKSDAGRTFTANRDSDY